MITESTDKSEVLRLIYKNVRRILPYDIYIVTDGKQYGLVDGEGKEILPFNFSNMTLTGNRYIRAYTDTLGSLFQTRLGFEFKRQGIFDASGKELIAIDAYTKIILTSKKNGIIFGVDANFVNLFDLDLKLLMYDTGSVFTFNRNNIMAAYIMSDINDVVLFSGYKKTRYGTETAYYGLDISKNNKILYNTKLGEQLNGEDFIVPIKDIWEDIQQYRVEALQGSVVSEYIGRLNGKYYALDNNYVPLNVNITVDDSGNFGVKSKKTYGKIKQVYSSKTRLD